MYCWSKIIQSISENFPQVHILVTNLINNATEFCQTLVYYVEMITVCPWYCFENQLLYDKDPYEIPLDDPILTTTYHTVF